MSGGLDTEPLIPLADPYDRGKGQNDHPALADDLAGYEV
jgi:hypothetical protein